MSLNRNSSSPRIFEKMCIWGIAEGSRSHNKYTNAGSTTTQTDNSVYTGSPTAPLPFVRAILVSSDSSMSNVESSVFRAIPIFISSAAALFSPDTSGATSSLIASTSLTIVVRGFLAAAGTFPSASSSLSLREKLEKHWFKLCCRRPVIPRVPGDSFS